MIAPLLVVALPTICAFVGWIYSTGQKNDTEGFLMISWVLTFILGVVLLVVFVLRLVL